MNQKQNYIRGKITPLLNTSIAYFLILIILIILGFWAKTIDIEFNNMPVDYGNYIRGIQMLFNGQNPYGIIEFFEPPWIAFILSPFYLLKLPVFWQIACFLFAITMIMITYFQLKKQDSSKLLLAIGTISLFILPTTIFAITLGQISALVGFSIVLIFALLAKSRTHSWEIAFLLFLLTLKPHIVFLPILFVGLELIRRREWVTIALAFTVICLFGILSKFFLFDGWLIALVEAIFTGKMYLGGTGLAASYYYNFSNIGLTSFLFIPHLIYTIILWLKKGLNQYLLFLLLSLNLLMIPYSHQYDYVILLPVFLYIFIKLQSNHHYLSIALVFLMISFIPLFTKIFFIIPAIIFIILLLLPPNGPVKFGSPNVPSKLKLKYSELGKE